MIRAADSHLELCHNFGITSANSGLNAWNVNFPEANVNNNNQFNNNAVRAFSDYREIPEDTMAEDMLVAYYECRKKKRSKRSEMLYEMDGIRNTLRLARQMRDGTYRIGTSICFVIDYPTKREVFAAQFRDRVCHTWLALRIEPLLERVLSDCSFANRRNRGTLAAAQRTYKNIMDVTDSGKEEAWIYKFDISGFFMSIDKRILWKQLEPLVNGYCGYDKRLVHDIARMLVFHCPQKDCTKSCPDSRWEGMPARKTLFLQDEWHGLPIGNLPSQMMANLYIQPFVAFCQSLGLERLVNYVDDFNAVCRDKHTILAAIPLMRQYLRDVLGLTLHPKKCYIQQACKGIQFLGMIAKPHRMYMGRRTARNAIDHARHLKSLSKEWQSVNSFLGLMSHTRSHKLRRRICDACLRKYGDRIRVAAACLKLELLKSQPTKIVSVSR